MDRYQNFMVKSQVLIWTRTLRIEPGKVMWSPVQKIWLLWQRERTRKLTPMQKVSQLWQGEGKNQRCHRHGHFANTLVHETKELVSRIFLESLPWGWLFPSTWGHPWEEVFGFTAYGMSTRPCLWEPATNVSHWSKGCWPSELLV